ncbi:MAG: DUF1993 domain-containing protein [Phenylobacterium sp.]
MSLSLYEASIPGYVRMLQNLDALLDKAAAHGLESGTDLATYTDAKLAEDMFPLPRQIHLASDAAKGGAARLARVDAPAMPDVETTIPELKDRIAKTIAFLQTIKPEQVNGDEERIIELKLPSRTLSFTAKEFLFNFSLPNFLFHVTTAYALLRSKGVPIGKMDYLAGGQPV